MIKSLRVDFHLNLGVLLNDFFKDLSPNKNEKEGERKEREEKTDPPTNFFHRSQITDQQKTKTHMLMCGLVTYFRKERRSLGEVTKYKVFEVQYTIRVNVRRG